MNLGDRIKARLEEVGLSQAELARRVGITQPAINHLIKRGPGGSAHLHKIARELATTPEYLSGETSDPSAGVGADRRREVRSEHPEPSDTVEIDEIDLKFGLGGQYLDGPVGVEKRKFSREWLRNFTNSPPELLSWTSGSGDSMAPTILDSDLILIDRSDRDVEFGDKFWALAYGNVGMIKRLRPMPDGGVKILSDNALVPPETAYDDELHIVGRVVAIVRRM